MMVYTQCFDYANDLELYEARIFSAMYCCDKAGEAANERSCMVMVKREGPLGCAARRELGMIPLFYPEVSGVATHGGLKP